MPDRGLFPPIEPAGRRGPTCGAGCVFGVSLHAYENRKGGAARGHAAAWKDCLVYPWWIDCHRRGRTAGCEQRHGDRDGAWLVADVDWRHDRGDWHLPA